MNKIHNIIWSTAQNAWVVVSEGTRSRSKSGVSALKIMSALLLLSPAGVMAATLPQGGSVSVGQGTIVTNGSNQMVIKQTTDKLGINWQSFNVGADGHVIFDQPGTHSIALNRVIGSDGSAILGKIDANGQVFLINPNGVIFGKDAKVNVGGLVASTMDITDADFKNGNYKLAAGGKNGEIINNGKLQAAEGGYIALLGKSVKNNGLIKAQLGTAALAAGDAVTLDFAGDGLIGVQVTKSTVKALIDNQGAIQADGGYVLMTARASNALMDTVVNNEGVVRAQTINSKAGKIFLDGGFDGGVVAVAGNLDASAPLSGDGGFIETSGSTVRIANAAKVTTKSVTGKTGTWLVDPTDFTISSGNAAITASGIGVDALVSSLASTNIELQTSSSGTERGNINVNSDITWNDNTTLTLTAHGDINLNSNINVNGVNGGLALKYGNNGADTTATVKYAENRKINLNGANSTYAENGANFIVLRTLNDLLKLDNSANTWGHFALAGDIDASATTGWNGGLGYKPAAMGGSFYGTLNGLNHSISNLYINRPTEDNVGLIGNNQISRISNIEVTGNITGRNNVGLVAGISSNTSFANVRSSGSVTGQTNVGGIAGSITQGNTSFASSDADVQGVTTVGGVLGLVNYQNLTYLSSTGNVNGTTNVGGLVGDMYQGSMNYGYALGNIYGTDKVGGVVGHASYSNFGTVYTTGDVTATGNGVGGLVGDFEFAAISQSFSTSKVSGVNDVGGLAGRFKQANLTNNYASGAVSGNNNVGGLVGSADQLAMMYTYSTGLVTGAGSKGGLIGAGTNLTVSESFWDTTSSGLSTSAAGIGYADLTDASIYSNWNISSDGGSSKIWRIYDHVTAPLLKAFMASATATVSDTTVEYKGHDLTDSDVSLNYSLSTNNGVSSFFHSNGDLFASLTSGGSSIRNAGTYVLDGITSSQFGYDILASGSANLIVTKAHLNIDASATDKTYDGNTNATVSFGDDRKGFDNLTITGTGAFEDKNAGAGKNVIISGLSVSGADAGNYTWDAGLTGSGDIFAREISVAVTGSDKTYDGTNAAGVTFTGSTVSADPANSGFVAGDDLVLSGTAVYSDKNAGAGKTITVSGVTLGGADAGNYVVHDTGTAVGTITKANLAITASGDNKTYDGSATAGVTLADDRLGSDDLTISFGSASFSDKNAGTGKAINVGGITVTGTDALNYNWNLGTTASADISKAQLHISANGQDKVYDGSTSAGVFLTDDRIGLDDLTVSFGAAAFSDKNAGAGKAVDVGGLSVTGADALNYDWNASITTTGTITKALLNVTANAQDKTYDGSTVATSVLSDNRISGDDLVLSGTSSFANKNAGMGKTVTVSGLSVTGVDADNYTWNTTTTSIANIAKASLVVSAVASDKTYDGTTTASTALSDNRVSGDNLTIDSTSAFTDKNAGAGKTVNVSGITLSGTDAWNYIVNTTTASTATINKASLTVTAQGNDKTYDGSTSASSSLTDNRIAGDNLVLGSADSAFSDKNAGTGKTVMVSGISVSGSDAGNYTWNTIASTTANISKALLSVIANAQDKAYDGTTNAQVVLSDDRVSDDVLAINYGTSVFSDKNAGAAKAVTIDGISLSGLDANNYTVSSTASTQADISKANLVVKVENGSKTEGSADGQLKWSVKSGSLYGTDTITGSPLRDPGEAVGLYDIQLGDLSAGSNYALSYVPGTFEITSQSKPPVVTPPKPPIIQPPGLSNDLNEAKEVVSTISSATNAKISKSETTAVSNADGVTIPGDYRLINFGIKLPEDITSEEI